MNTNNHFTKEPQLSNKSDTLNMIANKAVTHFKKILLRMSNKEILKSILLDKKTPYLIEREVHMEIMHYCNANNKDPLDIYQQIIGDEKIAAEIHSLHQYTCQYNRRIDNEHLEKQPPLSSQSTDSQINFQKKQLLQLLGKDVNIEKLHDFITKFQLSIKSNEVKHSLAKILFSRQLELLEKDPDKTKIIQILISSLKSLQNYSKYYLEEEWDYSFEEEEIKTAIISKREQEKKSNEIMNTNEGRIKIINMFLQPDGKRDGQFSAILEILRTKGIDKDFTLRLVYDDPLIISSFQNYLENTYIPYPSDHTPAHSLPKIEFCYSTEKFDDLHHNEMWTRDGAILTKNRTLKQSLYYKNNYNPWSYNQIALRNADIEQSKVYFQGGNIRTTNSYLFIGHDDIYINILSRKHNKAVSKELGKLLKTEIISKAELNSEIKKYKDEFGKDIIVVGLEKDIDGNYIPLNVKQECFHIDMCVTPISDEIIIVAEELGNNYFESIAKNLEKSGFTILRCPYLGSKDTMISYNNCLIEKYINIEKNEVKNIYLPQYFTGPKETFHYYDDDMNMIYPSESIKNYDSNFELNQTRTINLSKMNKQAYDVFNSLGYNIIPLYIHTNVIEQSGSLNCLTFEEREY